MSSGQDRSRAQRGRHLAAALAAICLAGSLGPASAALAAEGGQCLTARMSAAELAGKVVAWHDFIGAGAQPYDDNGHGTHVAGTIAGSAALGSPIGVAPDAQLVVAKALDAEGVAPGSALLAAAQWITDPDGNPATADFPSIVNNSWYSADANNTWFRPMVQAWVAMGIVPVF